MFSRVMFRDIIAKIENAFFPVYIELALADAVAQPVEAHVHRLGHFLFDCVVDDAGGALVVKLEWCGSLLVAKFGECLSECDKVFCEEVTSACFSLPVLTT